MPSSLEINHLDLFAGIGGFSLALKNVFTGKIITGYSEIDKYAIKIFQKQFPDAINYGNIKLIREQGLPRFNLITFGFPCQDISIAGKRVGLQGSKRSSLFFEAIRIIDANRPDYFIAENVKGLFSSHNGEDFLTALRAITDIGYDCQWQLLNTKWFLPQNRERVFIIGHLRGQPRPEVFPIGESSGQNIQSAEAQTVNSIDANYYKGIDNHAQRTLVQVGNIDTKGHNSLWGRVYDPEGIASSINSEGGGLGAKTGLYLTQKHQDWRQGKKPLREYKDFSPAIRSNEGDTAPLVCGIRRLTPTECERLQGFPDNFTEGISDTQRYKVLGNAISIPVVEEIIRRIFAAHT